MSEGFHFESAQWNRIFPYFLMLDSELRILSFGEKMPKLIPEISTQEAFFERFELLRPATNQHFDALFELQDYLFIFQSQDLKFRAQLLPLEQPRRLLLLATPWFIDQSSLTQAGLQARDFPLHSSQFDLMTLLALQQISLKDSVQMAQTLEGQNIKLQEAQRALQRYSSTLSALHDLQTDSERDFDSKIRACLQLGLETFDMQVATINLIQDEQWRVQICESRPEVQAISLRHCYPLQESLCVKTIHSEQPQAFNIAFPAQTDSQRPFEFQGDSVGSYLGVALNFEETQGTLCFYSRDENKSFDDRDLDLLTAFAALVRYERSRERTQAILSDAKEVAESANRSKSNFMANISHDLLTPLNAIIGMTELLQTSNVTPSQTQYLDSLWTASQTLTHLVKNILDVSKLEVKQLNLAHHSFNPLDICEQSLQALAAQAQAKNLDLYCSVSQLKPPDVMGDPERVRQILHNLVDNAIKFTAAGRVQLHLDWQLDAERDNCLCHYSVIDTGQGMDSERQALLHEHLHQGTEHFQNLGHVGLGLNIAHILSDYMGGSLSFQVLETGSRFECHLSHDLAHAPQKKAPSDEGSIVYALVSEPRRTMLQDLLAAHSCQVIWNPNSFSPNVLKAHVIIDMALPAALRQEWLEKSRKAPQIESCFLLQEPSEQADATAYTASAHSLQAPFSPRQFFQTSLRRTSKAPANATILLVEDNLDNCLITTRYLESAGYSVALAEDGEQGLHMALNQRYDLILMDLQMPHMDGFEVTQALRQFEQAEQLQPVPIIAFTAHSVEYYKEKAMEAGMQDFITKPFESRDLRRVIESWLSLKLLLIEEATEDALAPELHAMQSLDCETLRPDEVLAGPLQELHFDVALVHFSPGLSPESVISLADQSPFPLLAVVAPDTNRTQLDDLFDAVITKPIDPLELQAQIRAMVFRSGAHAPKKESTTQSTAQTTEAGIEARIDEAIQTYQVPEELADLVPVFVQTMRDRVRELEQHVEAAEWTQLERKAHKVKGTGSSFGFPLVSDLARILENTAHQKKSLEATAAYQDLLRLSERIAKHFEEIGTPSD